VRPGPGPGPDRQPARRGRAPGPGRGHAAGPAALFGRAARRPGHAAGPPGSRPAGPDQPRRAGPGHGFRTGCRPGCRAGAGVTGPAADVVPSGQAAARLLAAGLPPGSSVLVVGGNGLRLALRERGLRPVSTAAGRPAAVVQGYSPDISYGLLSEGVLAVRAGARYVAANADRPVPTARGEEMGNGSLVQSIAWATGVQPVVAGKPEPPLHAEAVQRTGARRPLVIGDRLDTDIEGGVRGGADTLLVLTGVSRPADA